MSNSPSNKEQSQLVALSPQQQNPGSARPEDFKVSDRGPGQTGDTKSERAALLAEADNDQKSQLTGGIPVRNEVPDRKFYDPSDYE